MKSILSEKNLVVVLFVMVLVTFSLAQEDSKKMTSVYSQAATIAAARALGQVTLTSLEENTGPTVVNRQ